MPATSLFLGVDGGNTKTVALIALASGVIVGAGRAGGSDIYSVETEAAAGQEIAAAVQCALDLAGGAREQFAGAVFSLAGADWPEDFALLETFLRGQGHTNPLIVNDAMGALRAGSPDGTGVVLAAGTGMAIGARSKTGKTWHSSNWPTAGGGSGLGKAGLNAVLSAELGVTPPTGMRSRLLAYFGVEAVEAVLHRITGRGARWDWRDMSRLAPMVLDAAEDEDPVAVEIVELFGHELGRYAVAAARQVGLGPDPFPLALSGGIFRHRSTHYASSMLEVIHAVFPGVKPRPGRYEPAAGALMLALESRGIKITDAVCDEISFSMPGSHLFAT